MPSPDTNRNAVAIVDDDPAVLDSLKFLLELEGYTVNAYASAKAFLEGGTRRPRCLIVDQDMPQMTGLELVDHLRTQGVNAPILLITGTPSPRIIAEAARLRIDKVLAKPTKEDELLGFLRLYT
jgi:two-component system, LuxR family, response regulator FixJ